MVIFQKVYMVPPSNISHNQWKACKLNKVIYSSKQSLQAWFKKFIAAIIFLDFRSSNHDSTLFFKVASHGCVLLYILMI